jgi:hypothetical protein
VAPAPIKALRASLAALFAGAWRWVAAASCAAAATLLLAVWSDRPDAAHARQMLPAAPAAAAAAAIAIEPNALR